MPSVIMCSGSKIGGARQREPAWLYSETASKKDEPKSLLEKLEKEHPRVALLQAIVKGVVEQKAFTFQEAHETVFDPDESKFLVKLKQNTAIVKSEVHMMKAFDPDHPAKDCPN